MVATTNGRIGLWPTRYLWYVAKQAKETQKETPQTITVGEFVDCILKSLRDGYIIRSSRVWYKSDLERTQRVLSPDTVDNLSGEKKILI